MYLNTSFYYEKNSLFSYKKYSKIKFLCYNCYDRGGVMKNNRGQALVEFVIILPVLLLLIFALIDFGRIIVCRNHLEGVMSEISNLTEEEIPTYLNKDKDYKITYSVKVDDYRNITLSTKLDLITPGLKSVLSNPYTVKVERSIVYE